MLSLELIFVPNNTRKIFDWAYIVFARFFALFALFALFKKKYSKIKFLRKLFSRANKKFSKNLIKSEKIKNYS